MEEDGIFPYFVVFNCFWFLIVIFNLCFSTRFYKTEQGMLEAFLGISNCQQRIYLGFLLCAQKRKKEVRTYVLY